MIGPTPTFDYYLTAVHKGYQALLIAPFWADDESVVLPATGGVYVFYEHNQAIYVGRTRNLRRRIRQHSHPNSTHFSASFAFLLARRETDLPKTSGLTRSLLAEQLAEPFKNCRVRVGAMSVRWVIEEDSIVQSLLEVYAAVTLRTTEHYNSFRTS